MSGSALIPVVIIFGCMLAISLCGWTPLASICPQARTSVRRKQPSARRGI